MLGFSPLASAAISTAGFVVRVAGLSVSEAQDTAAATVNIVASASLTVTEASDTASASVSITASASLTANEAADTASGSVSAVTLANLLATEAQDTASGSAQIDPAYADLVATEAADTASITTAIVASADLAVTEAQDTASGSASAVTLASLATTEAQDTASFAGQVFDACSFALVEAPDTAAFEAAVLADVVLNASETPDSASAGIVVQWAVIHDGPSVWTPQANGEAFWQDINPALPPSNVTSIGGAIGCASIGGIAVGNPTSAPPSGGAIGALWTQPANSVAYWDKINPQQPQANSRPTGALGGAPLGGIAISDGVADTPTETPGSAVWKPVSTSFTPQQQAA
jgi:hypothetical protein